MRRGCILLGVGCGPWILTCPGFVRRRRPLHRLKGGSSSRARPPRVPHHLLAAQPRTGWADSPGIPDPFNGIARASPIWSGLSVPTPVPLSGFLNLSAVSQPLASTPEFRGLLSCRSHSWDLPFRAFPSQESRTPLGVACSLAVIHRVLGRAARTLSPAVSPTPRRRLDESRRAQLPGSPPGYELPFLDHDHPVREGRRSAPGRPGSATTGSARSAASPASKLLVPPANPFTSDVSCPTPHGRCSPGLQPLQSFHLRPLGAL
jgi:hypothetical protein